MLKDILKTINIHPGDKKNLLKELMADVTLQGRVQVWGYKNNEVVYYDDGSNVVTSYAKHAMARMITGITHTKYYYSVTPSGGGLPVINSSYEASNAHSASLNPSGTMLSGEQYFSSSNGYPAHFSQIRSGNSYISGNDSDDYVYPLFPVKILLGTGKEYQNWSGEGNIPSDTEKAILTDIYGWPSSEFTENKDDEENFYSGTFGVINVGGTSVADKADSNPDLSTYTPSTSYRTLPSVTTNDTVSGSLNTIFTSDSWGVIGGIKNGFIVSSDDLASNIIYESFGAMPSYPYRGKGRPSFIYVNPATSPWIDNDIYLSIPTTTSRSLEGEISFQVNLPDQKDLPFGEDFYPYNGYTLKQIGLYSDSIVLPGDAAIGTTGGGGYGNTHVEEEYASSTMIMSNFQKTLCGTPWALRNISPIVKNRDLDIVIKWTLYFSNM